MRSLRALAIDAGMRFFETSGLHRLAAPLTRGIGAILMFHRVRPAPADPFAPNAGLEITPDFLDALLSHLALHGYDFVSLDAALAVLRTGGKPGRPFAVLTFDDGYRDLVAHALPVLERRRAPFTAFVTSGFADGTARLWWLELEEALRRLACVDVCVSGRRISRKCGSAREKQVAFADVYRGVRAGGEAALLDITGALAAEAGVDSRDLTREACLDWAGVSALAGHDLATIGAHSATHARLAKLDAAQARREMEESRDRIAAETGATPRHFCYPVGDRDSAGAREIALAGALGFESAVTTRPGLIFPEHGSHCHALPRLSVNGGHQRLAAMDVLLSGAPFALMNRGRRIAA